MTAIGFISILISFLAFAWASHEMTNRKLALFLAIVILHIGAAFVYYFYVQTNDADTRLYYFDPYEFARNEFAFGTVFVVDATQWLRGRIGGSYLDYFLLYQIFGTWGLAILLRSLEELGMVLKMEVPREVMALMFLPGMYFWTAAIGKDAPLFFCCSLAVWSSLNVSGRWAWFALAIGIMVLFRPHVALVSVGSLALSLVIGRGVSGITRVTLIAIAAVAAVMLGRTLQASLNVDISSTSSIASFVETQTSQATMGTDDSLARAFFPIKLLSLLYRPFFIDTNGIFGLVASVQNIVMLYITYQLLKNFRLWRDVFRESLPVRFATIYFLALFMMLALAYYNVGLGLRQREMATPAILLVFAAVHMISLRRRGMLLDEQAEQRGVQAGAGRAADTGQILPQH
ncbi:MAG: hypothetical protein ABI673_02480 [Novosphingobium sp.]